jgi:protein-S-isoprenylcysteine O-methyltransferase Ste14
VFALALILGIWAMLVNSFFDSHVRIQTERGHHVVTTGPYAIVRHPGYVSGIMLILSLPLMLESWWALIPACVGAASFVVRTALEDLTLQAELDGYAEFTQQTRYRLLPGIW